MNKILSLSVPALCLVLSGTASASMDKVRWSGFFNIGTSASDTNDAYLDSVTKAGTWQNLTNVGLNISADLGQGWHGAAQIIAHEGGDGIILDWGFVRGKVGGGTLNAGKLKYSNGLFSEIVDVSYAYPWIRAPQVVYGHAEDSTAVMQEALKGVSYEFDTDVSDEMTFGVKVFYGEGQEKVEGATPERFETFKKLSGLKFKLASDNMEIIAYHTSSDIEEEGNSTIDGRSMSIQGFGFNMDKNNFVINAEAVSSKIDGVTSMDSDAGYVMLGYRFGKTMPHITAGSRERGDNAKHTSLMLGLRHEMTETSSLKFEYEQVDPENGGIFFESLPSQDKINIISAGMQFVF